MPSAHSDPERDPRRDPDAGEPERASAAGDPGDGGSPLTETDADRSTPGRPFDDGEDTDATRFPGSRHAGLISGAVPRPAAAPAPNDPHPPTARTPTSAATGTGRSTSNPASDDEPDFDRTEFPGTRPRTFTAAGTGTPPTEDRGPGSAATARASVDPRFTAPALPPVEAIEPGMILFDKYRVVRELGRGAMGEVWLVEHRQLGLRALKTIREGLATDPRRLDAARKRFEREARVMAEVKHPNAVQIHDCVFTPQFAYIDMEYVEGEPLGRVLAGGRPRPVGWVLHLMRQLCEVLQEMHARRIVHRDLKPSNIMIVPTDRPDRPKLKVLDFGIARILDPDEIASRTADFIGTPAYAAPEQLRGDADPNAPEADNRADLYAAAVILHELVTGKRMYEGHPLAIMLMKKNDPPPRLRDRRPDLEIPPALEDFLQRALSANPDDRPANAAEFHRELLAALGLPDAGDFPAAPASIPDVDADSDIDTDFDERRGFPETDPGTATPARGIAALRETPAPEVRPDRVEAPPDRRRRVVAAIAGLSLLAIALVVWLNPGREPTPVADNRRAGESGGNADGEGRDAPPPPPVRRALPSGFTREGGENWFEGAPPDRVRDRDRRPFVHVGQGVYLPEGHAPAPGVAVEPGRPPETVVRVADGVAFRWIDGGEFQLGALPGYERSLPNERPNRPVAIRGYYLQVDETSNGEIADWLQSQGRPAPETWARAFAELVETDGESAARALAAVGLTRREAREFARFHGGDLPTEPQWEFAARSRDSRRLPFVWSDPAPPSTRLCNIDNERDRVLPADAFPADVTDQGIRSMQGNVREWCREMFTLYTNTRVTDPNPSIPPDDQLPPDADFPIRGGSFRSNPDEVHTTHRAVGKGPDAAFADVGFRVVLEIPEPLALAEGGDKP